MDGMQADMVRAMRLTTSDVADKRIVPGDAASKKTWTSLDGLSFNLILSMPRGGLYFIANDTHRAFIASKIWEHLSPGGIALLQFDISGIDELTKWTKPLIDKGNAQMVVKKVTDPVDKAPYLAVCLRKV